ncbi:MAG: hypothetical protein GY782_07625 [Gammaproteobacteria bacterium]|nr:hypothetical protein [Gammaproteobacteria bacterium]
MCNRSGLKQDPSLVIVVGAIQGPILLLAISALVTLVTTIILHDRTGDSLALIT